MASGSKIAMKSKPKPKPKSKPLGKKVMKSKTFKISKVSGDIADPSKLKLKKK